MEIGFKITNELVGERFDVAVTRQYDSCSRSHAANLISKGRIRLSGKKKKPGYKVKIGDFIEGDISDTNIKEAKPEKLGIDVIFEDRHIIVINKGPGMVVHPAPGNLEKTLVNAVLSHAPQIKKVGGDPLRSGVVHRLDKDTSGVIVMAKTQPSLLFLQKEFKQRRVEKIYLALVSGNIKDDKGQITQPIGRHPVKRKIMCINSDNGKYAKTLWQVEERYGDATLVRTQIKTGRTHQIRVHFYAFGYPVLGDKVYQLRRNRKKNNPITPRQMLHAHQISFRHPFSGQRVCFKAPLPEDFLKAMQEYSHKE